MQKTCAADDLDTWHSRASSLTLVGTGKFVVCQHPCVRHEAALCQRRKPALGQSSARSQTSTHKQSDIFLFLVSH